MPKRALAAAAVLLFASSLSSPAAAANGQSAALDLAREARVTRVGDRLARAAVGLCAQPAPVTGMVLHDIASYAQADRATIRRVYNISTGFGVRLVDPAGAAARAGIRPGDEIVALDGAPTDRFAPELIGRTASPARTDRFELALHRALAAGSAVLRVRRDGAEQAVRLAAEPGCGGRFVVDPSGGLDAWSDGAGAAVTAGLVDLASDDDELAFVLAHEMSHNILHHAEQTRGHSPLLAGLGIGAGAIKAAEIAADREAVTLMLRAGYDPAAAERLLTMVAARRGPTLATTHPGETRRIGLLRAAIAAQSGIAR